MKKKSWDEIWIGLCHSIANMSNSPSLKVGAVIVSEDNESVLSIGYNGDEKGGSNVPDSEEPGKSGFIHAEVNAIAKMNYLDTRDKKIYLTHSPCPVCARLIINAGIKRVIFSDNYRDYNGIKILRERGIDVKYMSHWK